MMNRGELKIYFVLLLGIGIGLNLFAGDGVSKEYITSYIEEYASLAVQEMAIYGIPASITLAQGILESGSGRSRLARKGNNHFGIKCKIDWTAEFMYADDDAPGECFRKYPTAADSYRDHSEFLKNNRLHFYDHLFELSSSDYYSWAHGLKKAGYATAPRYAERLIYLIEKYELHQYDKGNLTPLVRQRRSNDSRTDLAKQEQTVDQERSPYRFISYSLFELLPED